MFRGFIRCFIYLACTGIAGFFLGRVLPKKWFRAEVFPFKSFKFEKNGKIYDRIKIRKWQNRVPDMSKIFKKLMPAKKLVHLKKEAENFPLMIQETCIAEFIHTVLFILGFGCVFLWEGIWGWIVAVVYNLFGNIPFIIIQRYNRPRLCACERAAVRAGLA